jgi:hypothetical protein
MRGPMPLGLRLQGDAMNRKAILMRYAFAAEPACRCAACEGRRAVQLAQALRNKFGRGLAPARWRSN